MKGIKFIKNAQGKTLKAEIDLQIHRQAFEKFFGKNTPSVIDLQAQQDKFDAFFDYTMQNPPKVGNPDIPSMIAPASTSANSNQSPDIPEMVRPASKSSKSGSQPDIPDMIKPK